MSTPHERLAMSVNGHRLEGEKRRGRWSFTCPSWPSLAELHAGEACAGEIIKAFMARALASAVEVRGLAASVFEYEIGGEA